MTQVLLKNLGTVNKNFVQVGKLKLWFSYETCVAFQVDGHARIVRENDWGTTTGKLLNELESDKKARVQGERFENLLKDAMDGAI